MDIFSIVCHSHPIGALPHLKVIMLRHWHMRCISLIRLVLTLKNTGKERPVAYQNVRAWKWNWKLFSGTKICCSLCWTYWEKERGILIVDKYAWITNGMPVFWIMFDLKFYHEGWNNQAPPTSTLFLMTWLSQQRVVLWHSQTLHASPPTPSISASTSAATSIAVAGETWIARTPPPPPSHGWRR